MYLTFLDVSERERVSRSLSYNSSLYIYISLKKETRKVPLVLIYKCLSEDSIACEE